MTEDKGAGEGPYTFYERADGRFMVEGPGIFTDFASEGLQRGFAAHLACNEVHRLNMVFALGSQRGFAEGRKAAEKDLRELLSITEKLYCATDEAFSCPELFAWKKARGIE